MKKMRKWSVLVMTFIMIAGTIFPAAAFAEGEQSDDMVYAVIDMPLADFYYGELKEIVPAASTAEVDLQAEDTVTAAGYREEGVYDALTSASARLRTGQLPTIAKYFVDDEGNVRPEYVGDKKDRLVYWGVKDVAIAIPRTLYDSIISAQEAESECSNKALTFFDKDTEITTEAPAEYKMMMADGSFSKMVTETTVCEDPKVKIEAYSAVKGSAYGEYLITAAGVDMTAAEGKTKLMGSVLTDEDGNRYATKPVANWYNVSTQANQIAFCVTDGFQEFRDKAVRPYKNTAALQGKTIRKIEFLMKDAPDIVVNTDIEVKKQFTEVYDDALMSNAVKVADMDYDASSMSSSAEFTGLPEGYDKDLIAVSGPYGDVTEKASFDKASGKLTITQDKDDLLKPGAYTATFGDDEYVEVSAAFAVNAEVKDNFAYIENNTLVMNDENFTLDDYKSAMTSVKVNDKERKGTSLNPDLFFGADGKINFDAQVAGPNGSVTVYFPPEAEKYKIVIKATGYPDMTFRVVHPDYDVRKENGIVYPYGVFEPSSFSFHGGKGNVTITCDRIHIASRVYADITFSSLNYTKVTVDGVVYEPIKDEKKKTTTFRIPVNVNMDTAIKGTTTAMNPDGTDINYTVVVGVDKDELKPVVRKPYVDGFYTTRVSTYRLFYGYKEKSGEISQVGINYPDNDYEIPVTVQIKDGKIVDVAYTEDPLEYNMGNTSSDFNYLLWAMNGRDVSDYNYAYLNDPGENYDSYHLDPHPAKNGTGMKDQIVEKNDVTGVDTVTAATLTSRAIIDSVDQSLTKAEYGMKDDPEPELPKPDTSDDIIPADGYYIAKSSSKGFSLGNNDEIVLNVKNGKITAEFLYIMQRESAYPYIFAGTEAEALAAGEEGWLTPVKYDYGGTLSSGKFAEGSLYTDVSIRSLDKYLPFVMRSKSSQHWFNRVIKLDSASLFPISEDVIEQMRKDNDVLIKMAELKEKVSPLAYDYLKKKKATDEMLTTDKAAISTLVDAVMEKVDIAKAAYKTEAVSAIEATASKFKEDLAKDNAVLLEDQVATQELFVADEDALFDAISAAIESAGAEGKANSVLDSDEVKDAVKNKGNYTSDSYKAFAEAKAALEAALKDSTKTPDEISEAAAALRKAASELQAKGDQKITVKAAKKNFKVKVLKKKAKTFKAVTVKGNQGKLSYSAKATGKSKKVLKFNKKTGKITVKKGSKKGKYVMTVTVKAAATDNLKAASKKVKVTVKVK